MIKNNKNVIEDMRVFALKHNVPIIGCDSAKVLYDIVHQKQPSRILEIGTAIGYSTLIMAEAMPANATILTIEIDEQRLQTAIEFLNRTNVAERINVLYGDAACILPTLNERYDLIFIDAAKGQYLKYLKILTEKLMPGAVIIADNVLFRGMVLGEIEPPRRYRTLVRRLQQYLKYVCENENFKTKIYDIGDGIAVSYFQGENS